MPFKTRALQLIILAAVGAILIYHFHDHIWTGSVDIAHHYSLVTRLTEFGHRSASVDPSLGEMQIYPALSHYIAMWVGRAFGSPLVGMQVVGLISAITVWAAIVWMFSSLPRSASRFASGLLILLLVINGMFVHLEVFDSELVGNYFYSQLVAQAMAFVALAVALSIRRRGVSRFVNYVFLILAMLLVESAHLLPAVELLGFLGLLVCVDLFSAANRARVGQVVWSFGLVLIGAIAVVVHPTFRAMRVISENNGTLPLNLIPNIQSLLLLAAVVAILSLVLVFRWLLMKSDEERQANLAILFLGVFGLGVTALCILQTLALQLGQGSEYACRKYAFALSSMLLVNLALLPIALNLDLIKWLSNRVGERTGRAIDICLIALIVLTASLTNFPQSKAFSLAQLVHIERELNLLNNTSVDHRAGVSNYAVRLPNSTPLLDYMFSIGIFKTPRTDNAYDILRNRILSQPDRIGEIITAVGTKPYDVVACRRSSTNPAVSVIDGACFVKSVPRRNECSGWFHMTPDAMIDYASMKGFSNPESDGTWTDDEVATFTCKMPTSADQRPKSVRIVAQAFVQPQHAQTVEITLNGTGQKLVHFVNAGAQQVIDLPVPADSDQLKITFHMPDAVSPQALGMSTDARKLGLYLKWIQFSTDTTFE